MRSSFSVNVLSVLPTGRSCGSLADRSGLTAGEGRVLTSPNGTPRAVVCLDGGDPAHRPELEANGLGPGVAPILPTGAYWRPTDAHRSGLADGLSADLKRQLPFDARPDATGRAPASERIPVLFGAGPNVRDGLLFPGDRPETTQ